MGPQADRLLRLILAHYQPTGDYSLDLLKDLARKKSTPLRISMQVGRQGWSRAA
jgi:hypothetical protein